MSFPKCFIKATNEFNDVEKFVPAPYFRKVFTVNEAADAQIKIAVCGFYKLFINGQDVTKGALAPYISNPDDIVYEDDYTVPLKSGKNVIGVMLGNGFCNNIGGWSWNFDKAPFRAAPQFALQLTCGDLKIKSDTSFKVSNSPIIFDDYRMGECYDANCEQNGWCEADFDDALWRNALSATTPRGEIRVCEAEPIVVTKELSPVSITKTENGYLYDFGQNCAGVCRLKINGEKGQKIELRHGELLIDGKLDIENIWFPYNENGIHWDFDKKYVHNDIYICRGDTEEIYTPSFTYHGFQYVEVSGITKEQATPQLLTYLVMNSNLKPCGNFTTSDKMLTALQDMTVRSDLANFYYFPTDCPQREKNGWTADAALSAEQLMLKFDASVSYREWLRNICKSQNVAGAIPGIVPTAGWGFAWGNGPAWDNALATIPYFSYKYRGDKQIIKESASTFIKYLHYLTTRNNEDGLLEIGLGDWCQIGERYAEIKAPLVVTDTITAIDTADKIAVMFRAVNMTAQADFAESIARQYRAAFRKNLIDFNTMTVKGSCQTSQAMAIFYNLFEEGEKPVAYSRLIEFIKAADDHLDTGVLGARVIFHVLSQFGDSDLALKMITRPDYPSYAYVVNLGYNTLWEKFTLEPVDSINHHFWGDITAWFVKTLAGLNYNPNVDDLCRVDVMPHIVSNLNDAAAYYDSNYGKIETAWVKNGDETVTLTVDVPDNFKGVIKPYNNYIFADGTARKTLRSGTYTLIKKS